MSVPALRPYRIRCAGLEYIALANGAAQAVADAIALHGVHGATAAPLHQRQHPRQHQSPRPCTSGSAAC